jgi:hypothetical protein
MVCPIVFLSTSSFLTVRVALVSDILRLLSNRMGAITLRSHRGIVNPRSSRISSGVVVVVPVIPWRPIPHVVVRRGRGTNYQLIVT